MSETDSPQQQDSPGPALQAAASFGFETAERLEQVAPWHGEVTCNQAAPDAPFLKVAHRVLRQATRNAERAIDEAMGRLREAEARRDSLARESGVAQERVDHLQRELSRRTEHVRELLAAQNAG